MEVYRLTLRKYVFVALLVGLGVMLRLLPHAPNFTAVGAIALFAGATLDRRTAAVVSLGMMIVSDSIIGYYPDMPYTWLGVMSISVVGMLSKSTSFLPKLLIGSASGSVAFFIISNFGVWHLGGLYPHTLSGLLSCYVMAIPFFGATLASSVAYGSVLFGLEWATGRGKCAARSVRQFRAWVALART